MVPANRMSLAISRYRLSSVIITNTSRSWQASSEMRYSRTARGDSSAAPPLAAHRNRFALPQPQPDTDKNSRGTVLVAGGSATSAGAVTLSGLAAFRAGAGKVLLAVPHSLASLIAVGFPETGVFGVSGTPSGDPEPCAAAGEIAAVAKEANVALVGPGLSNETAANELTSRLLAAVQGPALIIDAMALTGLWHQTALLKRHQGRLVITPHAGEMARLAGVARETILDDPLRFGVGAARRLDCVVVLKVTTTVIAQPDGPAFVHEANIPGLATSGSGDVLAGILAGLLARDATPLQGALWAVYLHAQAGLRLFGRLGPLGLLARELPAEIPGLMRDLCPTGGDAVSNRHCLRTSASLSRSQQAPLMRWVHLGVLGFP